MFIVTAAHEDERVGCLVGFTTQVSIDPPRFLVCLSVQNHTYDVAQEAEVLAVHVVEHSQQHLAELFGGTTGDTVDKFARCGWSAGPGGVPLLEDCARRLVGRVLDRFPFGDHVGFLLEPLLVNAGSGAPPLTVQQTHGMTPGHEA